MSFYNMVHGENGAAVILLAMLGLSRGDVPRYRDCYWNGEEICIYTRTGGGNREAYEKYNDDIRAVAGFLRDEDDDFDCTYATFYFSVPEQFKEMVENMNAADATPDQRWVAFIDKIKSVDVNRNDPQIKRVLEAVAPILGKIKKAVEK